MMSLFWKKCSYLSGMLALAILLGLIVFLCNSEIADFDLWLHLKTGEIIVEQGFIPTQDIFSCTIKGQPWNNHEWLFQAIFYLFLSFGGYDGLFTIQAILVALTFLTLLFLSDIHRRHYFTAFLLFILTMVYQTRITMRPDLFSLFFFSFYLYILAVHIEKKISVWLLFVVQVLWVNMHGFFIFGPLLILLSILCELIKRYIPLPWEWNKVGRLTTQEFQRLKVALLFTSLACFINPQYVKGALYPFMVIFQMSGESSLFFNYIQELQKPISWATLFTQRLAHYKVLIVISLYSFFINRKRIDISALILWIIFLLFSLQAIRNLTFFAIIAYLVTILNFSEHRFEDIMPVRFKRRELKLITIFLLNILMIAWMLHFGNEQIKRVSFDFRYYEMKSHFGGISSRNYPWAATEFVNKNHLQGNFFNDFNSGAFLVGRCSPAFRVFIDGRTEVYGPRFFKEYVRILDGDREAFLRAQEKYKLTGVFLGSAHGRISEKILKDLQKDKDWVLVYVDHDAVIFLKDVLQNKDIIAKFRKDNKTIAFTPFDFGRLGPRGVFPYREIKRAYNLESLGFDDLALAQVSEAIFISPGSSEPYYIRGLIERKKGHAKEAFKDFRIATMISPRNNDMRYHLGEMYFVLGDYPQAIRECEKVLHEEKKRPEIFLSCSKAYFAQGQYKKALALAHQGLALHSQNTKDFVKLADTLVSKKRFNEAFDLYEALLKINPRDAAIYYKIGLGFQEQGDLGKAKEVFIRGLRIEPSSSVLKEAIGKIKVLQKQSSKQKK